MPRDLTRIQAGDKFTIAGWGTRLFTCEKREGKMIYAIGIKNPFPTTQCMHHIESLPKPTKQ